jgi:hypothetical protein
MVQVTVPHKPRSRAVCASSTAQDYAHTLAMRFLTTVVTGCEEEGGRGARDDAGNPFTGSAHRGMKKNAHETRDRREG